MENNNDDFTDFCSPEYDYGSTDVDLNDDKNYSVIVRSQGKSTQNVEHNVDDESYNNDGSHGNHTHKFQGNVGVGSFNDESGDDESDDDGCSGDYRW